MLAGLTSRCTRPRPCAASSADATCEMISATRPGGSGPNCAHQRPDVTAAHEPHRDEQHAPRLAGLEDRDDVRIVHGRRGP